MSITHDEKTVNDYFNRLDEIFKLVKKCENHELNIDELIKTEPAHYIQKTKLMEIRVKVEKEFTNIEDFQQK